MLGHAPLLTVYRQWPCDFYFEMVAHYPLAAC